MPVTFAEDATGEEAKAADEARVTPDEKDGSARCETVKKVATELAGPSEKYQATAGTELCGLPDQCCAPEKCCGGRTPILSAEKRERRHRVARWCLALGAVVAVLGAAAFLFKHRERLFGWSDAAVRQNGDMFEDPKLFMTIKFKPALVDCRLLCGDKASRGLDWFTRLNEPVALAEQCKDDLSREDVINLFDDRNFAALFINSAFFWTFGTANLTEDEFFANHCGEKVMDRLIQAKDITAEKYRNPACRFDAIGDKGEDALACGGGFFRYKPYVNATYSEVRAVPAGYFSPEFQTCIIRCASGGYCPQSVRKSKEVWNYTTGTVETHYRGKCKFPSSVEKSVKPSLVDVNVTVDGVTTTTQEEVCPGSQWLHLCPAGKGCHQSQERQNCRRGNVCPAGTLRGKECAPLLSTALREKNKKACQAGSQVYPDYTEECAIFFASLVGSILFLSLLIAVTRKGSKLRARHTKTERYLGKPIIGADQSFVAAGRALFGIDGASKPASTDSELERTATHRNFHAAFNAGEAQEEISSWGGLDFGIHLRVVCFVGLTAWCLGFAAPFHYEALLAFIVLSAVVAYSAFALCYYDALGAAWHGGEVDNTCGLPRRRNVTCVGVTRRAYLATFVVLAPLYVFFAVEATRKSRLNGEQRWDNIYIYVLSVLLFIVVFVSAIGFVRISTARGARLKTLDDLYDDDDGEDDGDEDDAGVGLPSVDLVFEGLGLTLRGSGKRVLGGASGAIRHGCVTAIMGPSGAGKTTLMNVLADRAEGYGIVDGKLDLHIDGEKRSGSLRRWSTLAGFVPQDDVMLPELTVRQTISFYASIRADSALSAAQVDARVKSTLRAVKLQPSTWDSVIGDAETRGISGGQKKRVNVAMEVVANPSLLFLDEPTSGLDSTTSDQVIDVLVALAAGRGVNVVVVLHQPSYSIFCRFSKVIFLATGGTVVYHGQPEAAQVYFERLGYMVPEHANPADFYMEIISGRVEHEAKDATPDTGALDSSLSASAQAYETVGERLGAAWANGAGRRRSSPSMVINENRLTAAPAQRPWLWMFVLFVRRAALQEIMNPTQLVTDLVMMALSGAIFGFQAGPVTIASLQQTLIWAMIGLQLFIAVTSLRVFSPERVVFWRECARGSGMALSPSAYFFGKDLIQVPRLALLTVTFAVPFYTLTTPSPSLTYYWIVLVLVAYVISGYSYIASMLAGPKDAQLLVVCWVLVLTMISPPAQKISGDSNISDAIINGIVWLSPAQTRKLSYAWKMPPSFYEKPERDSALALTLAYPFQEAFADQHYFFKVREVDREQGICQIRPQYEIVEVFNLPILFFFGLMARLLALALLRFTALHKRGEVPLRSRMIGLCCCCCRRRNRDTPLARWASTPSFLTESLSTNNGASMDNEREPASPTTEQPRPTNFDSVPSIPSDLF